MSLRVKFYLILAVAVLAGVLAYPREDRLLSLVGIKKPLHLSLGLDLRGGAHLVFQGDFSGIKSTDKTTAMNSLITTIQNRVNPTGTKETVVQKSGEDRVIVEQSGADVPALVELIGKTADLRFFEVVAADNNQMQLIPTDISGKDVERADADFDSTRNQVVVSLRLKSGESTKKFGELTTRLSQTKGLMSTYLDTELLFGPATTEQPINTGQAQLTGNFDLPTAKKIANQINSGALPVPIKLVEQRTIGATLGSESIQRSILAGLIGLIVVALFMIAYYRYLGVLAVGALFVYTVLTLMLYKLSVLTPATIVLTLAGIAGFILSIGMAVDANILIFERMKEELKAGHSLRVAVEAGFDRAWNSIRDSNVSTLITTFILYQAGKNPSIRGFAVTLSIGVLISMFTAVVVTRTWLRYLIKTQRGEKLLNSSLGIKEGSA